MPISDSPILRSVLQGLEVGRAFQDLGLGEQAIRRNRSLLEEEERKRASRTRFQDLFTLGPRALENQPDPVLQDAIRQRLGSELAAESLGFSDRPLSVAAARGLLGEPSKGQQTLQRLAKGVFGVEEGPETSSPGPASMLFPGGRPAVGGRLQGVTRLAEASLEDLAQIAEAFGPEVSKVIFEALRNNLQLRGPAEFDVQQFKTRSSALPPDVLRGTLPKFSVGAKPGELSAEFASPTSPAEVTALQASRVPGGPVAVRNFALGQPLQPAQALKEAGGLLGDVAKIDTALSGGTTGLGQLLSPAQGPEAETLRQRRAGLLDQAQSLFDQAASLTGGQSISIRGAAPGEARRAAIKEYILRRLAQMGKAPATATAEEYATVNKEASEIFGAGQ